MLGVFSRLQVILTMEAINVKKHTESGTDISEVKRQNLASQQGGNQVTGLPLQGSMKVSDQFETEFTRETDA